MSQVLPDGDFGVHSIHEPEDEPDSFVAYVAIPDDERSTLGAVVGFQGHDLEAEVIRAEPFVASPRGRSIRYSMFADQRITPSGEMELLITGPSGGTAELRLSSQAKSDLAENAAFLLEPDILSRIGKGVHFHGIPIEFVPDPAQEAWTNDVWLPIARIHRPAFPGCHSEYTVINSQVNSYSADFSFKGLGAKGSLKFTVDYTRTYPAEATCKEACVGAKLSMLWGTTIVAGQPLSYGTRVKVWDIDTSRRAYRDLPAHFDLCGWSEAQAPPEGRTFENLTGATGGSGDAPGDESKIGTEIAGTVSVGIDFGGSPVTLSIAYSRSCSYETALKTTYMPGASYLGYRPRADNVMEKCWTILAP